MAKISPQIQKLLKFHEDGILKLDIGCADHKEDGFIGMDAQKLRGVDVVHNFEEIPFPFLDKTFTLLSAANIIQRVNPLDRGFIKWMDECWRILKYDGQFRISVPYAGSTRFWADPCHVNGVVPQTFQYFDPLAPLGAYKIYKPKPWEIHNLFWSPEGNIECLLSKRREDPSYEK